MTEKKIKRHLHRLWFHWSRLENALHDAHNSGVISYEGYQGTAPCESLHELKARIELATKEQLSTVIHREMRHKFW